VYELRVSVPGRYKDVRGNYADYNEGDIWKFGQTTKWGNRYTRRELQNMIPGGVTINQIYEGGVMEALVLEKFLIYGYFFNHGHLPPGNRIFR